MGILEWLADDLRRTDPEYHKKNPDRPSIRNRRSGGNSESGYNYTSEEVQEIFIRESDGGPLCDDD